MARTRRYRAGALVDEGFSLTDVSEHLADENSVVWVDLCAPDGEELELVATELGLHALASDRQVGLHDRRHQVAQTIQGNRLNIITKKVTSWAATIAVPTAITGGSTGRTCPTPVSHASPAFSSQPPSS